MTPDSKNGPPDGAYIITAEAVVNTYTAMAAVTTRFGPDRLRQALRPVIEEILTEYSGSVRSQLVLDRGAKLSAELYFRTTSEETG